MAPSPTPAVGTPEQEPATCGSSDVIRPHESLRPSRAGRWVEPAACKTLCHLILDDRRGSIGSLSPGAGQPSRLRQPVFGFRRRLVEDGFIAEDDVNTAVSSPKRRSAQSSCRRRRPALPPALYSEHVAPFLRFEAPLPNMLYAIGGRNRRRGPVDTVEMLDTWHTTWVPCPPMPRRRAGGAAVSLPDGRLLVVGGYSEKGIVEGLLANCDVYDPFRECWEKDGAAPLLRARWGHGCAMLGGKVYAVGGSSLQENSRPQEAFMQTLRHCEVYDPTKDRWEASSPLQVPRSGCRVITIGGRYIAAVGGCDDVFGRAETQSTIEVYCEQTRHWTVLDTKLQIPRTSAAVAAIDSRHILVAGGAPSQASVELCRLELPSGGADEIDKEASKKHVAILDMPQGRMGCQAAVLPLSCSTIEGPHLNRRCLLIVGGERCEEPTGPNPLPTVLQLSSVAAYDLDAGAWCEAGAVPNMAGERTTMALCQGIGRVAPARLKCS